MRRETLRPLVHAAVGLGVFLTPVLGRWGMAAVAGAFVLVNAFLLPRTRFGKALAREGEGRFGGLVTYPLAVCAGYLLFGPWWGATAWAVLALGDPAASLVGAARPWSLRIPWNRRKSIGGFLAFVAAGSAGALLVHHPWVIGFHAWSNLHWLAIGAALAGAVAETLPLQPDDNLPVVLAAGASPGLFRALADLLGSPAGGG